jgi:hypothetical protein
LIHIARELYKNDEFCIELDQTVYALDSTTIDLCLSLFPWARFRKQKGAIKLHTLIDLRGCIPSFIKITDGKVHDVNILDELVPEPGSVYVMDRGYLDFARLYTIHLCFASFVIRSQKKISSFRDVTHIPLINPLVWYVTKLLFFKWIKQHLRIKAFYGTSENS